MDSIGDYIYIIILAVAGLSGLLKKKKVGTETNSAPTTTKRSWEDILKELSPIDSEQELVPEKVEQVVKEKIVPVSRPISYENTEDFSKLRSKKNISPLSSSKTTSDKKNILLEENTEMGLSFNSILDARKAFIYSEIFHRKY